MMLQIAIISFFPSKEGMKRVKKRVFLLKKLISVFTYFTNVFYAHLIKFKCENL
jgi:hypothetical protein